MASILRTFSVTPILLYCVLDRLYQLFPFANPTNIQSTILAKNINQDNGQGTKGLVENRRMKDHPKPIDFIRLMIGRTTESCQHRELLGHHPQQKYRSQQPAILQRSVRWQTWNCGSVSTSLVGTSLPSVTYVDMLYDSNRLLSRYVS